MYHTVSVKLKLRQLCTVVKTPSGVQANKKPFHVLCCNFFFFYRNHLCLGTTGTYVWGVMPATYPVSQWYAKVASLYEVGRDVNVGVMLVYRMYEQCTDNVRSLYVVYNHHTKSTKVNVVRYVHLTQSFRRSRTPSYKNRKGQQNIGHVNVTVTKLYGTLQNVQKVYVKAMVSIRWCNNNHIENTYFSILLFVQYT